MKSPSPSSASNSPSRSLGHSTARALASAALFAAGLGCVDVSPVWAQDAWWDRAIEDGRSSDRPQPEARDRDWRGSAAGGIDSGGPGSGPERAVRDSAWPPAHESRPGPGSRESGRWPERTGGALRARSGEPQLLGTRAAPIAAGRIERSDLAPVIAGDGSGLPNGAWDGLTVSELAQLASRIVLPPRSPALKSVLARLLESGPGVTGEGADLFDAFRLDSLSRAGLGDRLLARASDASGVTGPGQVVLARAQLAEGRGEEACASVRGFGQDMSRLPDLLMREAFMLRGTCALIVGDTAGAGLAASLLRDSGGGDGAGMPALEMGRFAEARPAEGPAQRWGVADAAAWLSAGGQVDAIGSDDRALGDTLMFIARADKADVATRLTAAENAARRNVLAPAALADIYSKAVGDGGSEDGPAFTRAKAYMRAMREVTPFQKVRAIRAYLDAARPAGLYGHALAMMDEPARDLRPVAELAWFAETAIEIALVAGDNVRARDWLAYGQSADPAATGNLDHWAALAAIRDADGGAERGRALEAVEAMALDGRFGSEPLHRLATVLDALDIHVPIPLWEAASRTPQPTGGHLPETGLLSRLQEASREKRFAETVFLTIQAIGPGTAADANLLALGDAIRALRRAGLDREARALGFEALFAVWPRRTSG